MTTKRIKVGGSNRSYAPKIQKIVGDKVEKAIQNKLKSDVRKQLADDVDKTMSKVFKFIAYQIISKKNFTSLKNYTGNWPSYSGKYLKHKRATKGHQRWFSYTGEFAQELNSIPRSRVTQRIGQTRVSISRDSRKITLRIAPNIRVVERLLETQFRGLLSDETMDKLASQRTRGGDKKAYRQLIGPMFAYFLKRRVPATVGASLKRMTR